MSGRAEIAMPGSKGHVGVYTGMFDPPHLGHMDIIERGSRIFDRLVVGVGVNPEKTPFFSIEERVHLLQEMSKTWPNVEVRPFTGLAVKFVKQVGASVMIRGLRTVSDMEYEFSMSLTNQTLDAGIETVFLLSKVDYSHMSSTLIRQIAAFGGDLRRFLPAAIVPAVEAKVHNRKV
jgi:pantetheine-phosphate adenylyltransferase